MFRRIANLIKGFLSLFISGIEKQNPEALLEVEDADVSQFRARVSAAGDRRLATGRDFSSSGTLKGKSLFHPLRLALTGRESGPDMGKLLPMIGRARAAARLTGMRA